VESKDTKSIDLRKPKNGAKAVMAIAYPGKWEAK